jgi:alkanesulfonate monooxygenase SsuD/methylene tetrahydromethanopterin reductase-like flavin-dependent oxidoreductase (luciferase family)
VDDVRVGIIMSAQLEADPRVRRHFLEQVDASSLDHLFCGDHVSFFVGAGADGLLGAATLLAATERVSVQTGVYLLPLRHPTVVARQLVDLSLLAPGRFVFGVGVGGEDPHEFEVCGIDPTTRGRRMDESLDVLRRLLTGQPVDHHGEFYDLDGALVTPAPAARIPFVIGGRSDAALRRAARAGDGWLGIWNSPARFGQAASVIADEAARLGRVGADAPVRHAMQVWCGFGDSPGAARPALAEAMQAMYTIPFERFEKYSPYGTPTEVAAFLGDYVDQGCTSFNLIPVTRDPELVIDGAVAVGDLLRARAGQPTPAAVS